MKNINIEDGYKGLLSEILDRGSDKEDRTGTGTKSLFGRTIRHNMSLGFPILTGTGDQTMSVQVEQTKR